MKRKEFIKALFGLAIFQDISSARTLDNIQYPHDDIFCCPYNNTSLVYFKKEHPVYEYLKNRLTGRIVDESQFNCYLPYRDFVFPIKKSYTIQDFECLILLLHGRYSVHQKYAEYENGTFMRFIYQKFNHVYQPDLFLAR
jgi:hypothetical protein